MTEYRRCDRCGRTINGPHYEVHPDNTARYPVEHLCTECHDAILPNRRRTRW